MMQHSCLAHQVHQEKVPAHEKDLDELSCSTFPFPSWPKLGTTLRQYHPNALNGWRAGSELRTSRNPHGNGAGRLLPLATVPAI